MSSSQKRVILLSIAVGLLAGLAGPGSPVNAQQGGTGKAAAPGAKGSPGTSAPAPAAVRKTFVVKVPPGGKFVLSIPETRLAPLRVEGDKATLDIPTGVEKFTLRVVDEQTGYAARLPLEVKTLPAELTVTAADLKLVNLVRVRITGKGDQPVARAAVYLTDALGKVHQSLLHQARQGEVEFEDVAEGKGKLEVVPQAPDPSTSRDVQVELRKGETTQTVNFAVPDITAVVEGGRTPPAGSSAGTTGGTTGTQAATGGATAAPGATGAAPAPPAPEGGAGTLFQTVLGFAILAAIIFGIYAYGRNQGWTIEGAMAKLGVQPQAVATSTPVGPGPAPAPSPPPPVVADPNRCQFCGEMKDPATGACSCTLTSTDPGFGSFSTPGVVAPAAGAGPRLIATAGVYMGEIFPLLGETVIGRDSMNPIPLDRDTTVSRRHARISMEGNGFRIVDEGSSNGTYVNGARVSETLLQPGDEVSIGGTRFRFEV